MIKKKYIQDLIGEGYITWGHAKIFLTAPVGMGKTTFVLKVLLPYYKSMRKKILILCNRRLLRQQYWYELVRQFNYFDDLNSSVTIASYQEVAENFQSSNTTEVLDDADVIICDEAHYFYADSDFNGYGTYALLQVLIQKCIAKPMLFMSATSREAFSLIMETIRNCGKRLKKEFVDEWSSKKGKVIDLNNRRDENTLEILEYDFTSERDYKRFSCFAVPNDKVLCKTLADMAQVNEKSLVFIDSKDKAVVLRAKLIKDENVSAEQIGILNADIIESPVNTELVEALAIAHKLIPKILITSSVLDNGVSILDPDVKNVVIVTESKISFLQMIGRVRAEATEACNLYFLMRDARFFRERSKNLEIQKAFFEKIDAKAVQQNPYYFLNTIWENNPKEEAELLRKSLIMTDGKIVIDTVNPDRRVEMAYGNCCFEKNEAARRKISDQFLMTSRLYAFAVIDPLEVIFEQMHWINKKPEELVVIEDTYAHEVNGAFVNELLKVNGFDSDGMKTFKAKMVKNYRRECFPDIPAKNGTLSNEKLAKIVQKFDLEVKEFQDKDTRRKLYSIVRKNGEEGDVDE